MSPWIIPGGSRALCAPERQLPLSNRVAICLSRIKAEVGTNERVDTAVICRARAEGHNVLVAYNPCQNASDLTYGMQPQVASVTLLERGDET